MKETALEQEPGRDFEAIVPAKALGELVRIGQGASADEIGIGVQENQVVFDIEGIVLTARRIDGQFPNFRQLRPESFEAEINVPREELLDAVRRVSVMAQRNAPLRLRFEEGGAHDSGAVPGRRRGDGVTGDSVQRRCAGDRVQPGLSPRGARVSR